MAFADESLKKISSVNSDSMEEASEQQVQEKHEIVHEEKPVFHEKKESMKIKIPSILRGDTNQPKHDWFFGFSMFVTMILLVFWDVLPALAATVILFVLYGQLDKQVQ